MRADRGRGVPDWPSWCYLPLAAAYAIVSADAGVERLGLDRVGDVARLGALATWRVTQGIYRIDPALYVALIATPVDGELPCDVLYHLPEWCVYVEASSEFTFAGLPLLGFFAHLEWDSNTGRAELRLLLDCDGALVPVTLHLGAWSLPEAIARWQREAERQAAMAAVALPAARPTEPLRKAIAPMISLLLYLCSTAAEIGDGGRRPENPTPTRTKRGWRMFPAPKPTTWDVGMRIGAALRAAYQREQVGRAGAPTGRQVRPHVRRAHWHTYVIGPRADVTAQRRELRWLPPIAINVDDPDGLPAVVRRVDDGR